MTTQIIPFEGMLVVPDYLKKATLGNKLETGGGTGFPSISIKGKVFHIRRGDSNELITNPQDPDAPASNIEVIVLNGNPGTAKVWYEGTYTEGSDMKPSCYSNDGVTPAADSKDKQANKCAICPRNVWGARLSEDGKTYKGRECSDSKRLAIATVNAIEDAMLIRIPAGSLKAFNEYLKFLATRGIENYQAVVTRIGFDYSVAHAALTFKPVGTIDQGTFSRVSAMVDSEVVSQIIGIATAPVETVQETPVAKVEAAPAIKPPPKSAPVPPEEMEDPAPKVKVKVEGEAPVEKPATKKVSSAPVVVEDMEDGMDAALDSIDWDD